MKQRLQAGGKSLVRGVRQQYADAFLSATGRAGRSEACCGLLHFSPKVRATVTGLVGGAVDTASPNAETLPPDVPYDALVQHMRGQDLTPDFSTDLPAKAWWQRWWWWEQRWWWVVAAVVVVVVVVLLVLLVVAAVAQRSCQQISSCRVLEPDSCSQPAIKVHGTRYKRSPTRRPATHTTTPSSCRA